MICVGAQPGAQELGGLCMEPAVVTGAASGIGRALARQLAAAGRTVYLADVTQLDEMATELGP
jgi:NAD(P)-dependent dehydrogenase (short-subunit alcohol dehydrogenase family)